MYCNPLKPINLSLRMDSKDMYTALLDSFHARRAETIAGHLFAVVNIGLRNGEATADLQQIHVTERAPWTGEGRPPVGTLCEAHINNVFGDLIWAEARIIHHHPEHARSAAIAHGDGRLLGWAIEFRPIRTLEQIAVEQKNKAINAAMQGLEPFATMAPLAVVEYLYDAGFIKQPTDQ